MNKYMPVTCSAFNSLPAPYNQSGFGAVPQNGIAAGTQHAAFPVLPAITSTGVPTAAMLPGAAPAALGMTTPGAQIPSTVESTFYTAGFLRTQIGRRVRVEFLLGTNLLTDRSGTLVAVGASYIILRPFDSDDLMMCDIYSIKFVTIIL